MGTGQPAVNSQNNNEGTYSVLPALVVPLLQKTGEKPSNAERNGVTQLYYFGGLRGGCLSNPEQNHMMEAPLLPPFGVFVPQIWIILPDHSQALQKAPGVGGLETIPKGLAWHQQYNPLQGLCHGLWLL